MRKNKSLSAKNAMDKPSKGKMGQKISVKTQKHICFQKGHAVMIDPVCCLLPMHDLTFLRRRNKPRNIAMLCFQTKNAGYSAVTNHLIIET